MKLNAKISLIISLILILIALSAVMSVSVFAETTDERWTPYGTIPANENLNTFAVFAKGTNDSAYTFIGCWGQYRTAIGEARNAIHYQTGAYKGGTAVLYMRSDNETLNSESNFNQADQCYGTLLVDLGNHTLTTKKDRIVGLLLDNDTQTDIEFKNGTIKAKSASTENPRLNPIAEIWAESEKYSGTKTTNLTFSNVTFGSTDATLTHTLFKARNDTPGNAYYTENQKAIFNLTFNDCTFDFGSQTNVTLFEDSTGHPYVTCNVKINGGTINAKSFDVFSLMKASSAEDNVVFAKNAGGERTRFNLNSNTPTPTAVFNTDEGEMKLACVGYDNQNSYTLSNVYTEYGTVPLSVANKTFLMFYNDKYIYAFDRYYDFINTAKTLLYAKNGALKGKTLNGYMTKAYSVKSTNGNFAQADGFIELNLGGNVLTHENGTLFDIVGKATDGILANTSLTVKNGTILTVNNPPIKVTSNGTDGNFGYNGTKEYTLTFENVTFDKDAAAMNYIRLAYVDTFDELVTESGSKNVNLNMNFNNCNFNSTNGLLFDFSNCDYVDTKITVNGGNLKSDFMSNYGIMKFSDPDDTLTFGKTDGGDYMTLTMAKDASTPTATFNGGTLEFVRVSETADTALFKLSDAGLNSYAPKVSITLDSSLKMNVYIPVDETISFTLDGITYTDLTELNADKVILDGKSYYLKQITLDPKRAAADVPLSVTISHADSVATGRFTFSVPKYANQIFADGSDIEKQIMRDILSYVRAAYNYFGTDTDGIVARIDSLIGVRYDETAPYVAEGSTANPTVGLISATFSLDSTPALKFYIPADADATKYEFYIGDRKLEAKTATDTEGKYIIMNIYAYEMCETVTYYINEELSGSFHIAAYHEWAKTQNNDKLVTLVERFWKYCQSARVYKNSVNVTVNFVDESGNKLADSQVIHAESGKEFKITSPAVSGYYTRDLYLKASATSDKEINITYKRIPGNVDSATVKEKLPDIAAWGDSITAGSNAYNTTSANQYLINLEALGSTATGGTYSEVLRNLIASKVYGGINVANCGVGGETTFTIAARANTANYYLYLGSSVILSGSPVVIPLMQSKNGMSGREGVFRKDITDAMSNVSIVGTDEDGNEVTVTGIITCEVTENIPEGQYIWDCDYKYLKYTFTRTDGKTNTVNFASGAKVVTNASVIYDGRTCIIFMGENGGYNGDTENLIAQQKEILTACGLTKEDRKSYLIISTTSGSTSTRETLNTALASEWGDNYINMGNVLNSSRFAYDFAGFSEDAIVSVQENIIDGTVTKLLLADDCHPNAVGYSVIGNVIFERLFELGTFDAIFDYYDELNA